MYTFDCFVRLIRILYRKFNTLFYYYSQWGETEFLGTAANTGLSYQRQMMVIVEKLVE
jgi:hypothetical protein